MIRFPGGRQRTTLGNSPGHFLGVPPQTWMTTNLEANSPDSSQTTPHTLHPSSSSFLPLKPRFVPRPPALEEGGELMCWDHFEVLRPRDEES